MLSLLRSPPGPLAPTDLAPFVGRSRALARLRALLLAREPLISVVGTAGVGKSRLVREVLRDLELPATVHWCSLAEVNASEVPWKVSRALGVPADALAHASQHLPPTLVVLDSAELVLPAVAALPWGGRLCALLTTRTALELPLEIRLTLDPLDADEATELLLDRARRVREDLPDDPASASEIAQSLDGLPLAIELAAPLLATRTMKGLARELKEAPGPLLGRTMDQAVRRSWLQLDERAQEAVSLLAAFRGSFDRALAASVLGPEGETLIDTLCRASLLKVESQPDGELALRLYEGVRQFVLRQPLFEQRQAHARAQVARAVVEAACEASSRAYGPGTPQALATLQQLLPEILQAGEDPDVPTVLAARGVLALEPLLDLHRDARLVRRPIDRLLQDSALEPDLRARLLALRSDLALDDQEHDLTERMLQEALSLEPSGLVRAYVLRRLASFRQWSRSDPEGAIEAAQQARDCARAAGVRWLEARALFLEACAVSLLGNFGAVERLAEVSLALSRREGDLHGQLAALMLLGQFGPTASARLAEGLALSVRLGVASAEMVLSFLLAMVRVEEDLPQARPLIERAIELGMLLGQAVTARQMQATFAMAAWSIDADHDCVPALEARIPDGDGPHLRPALAFLAAALAERDALAPARRRLLAMEEASVVPIHSAADDLCRAVVTLAEARALDASDPAQAGALRASARQTIQTLASQADPEQSVVLCAIRVARRALARDLAAYPEEEACGSILRLGPEGRTAQWDDGPILQLARRAPLRRLLLRLCEAAERGEAVTVDRMFAAGWPGQQIRPDSAAHRVYVAIAELRKNRMIIETVDEGYRLARGTRILRE